MYETEIHEGDRSVPAAAKLPPAEIVEGAGAGVTGQVI